MNRLTFEQARELVEEELAPSRQWSDLDSPLIIVSSTEYAWGWVFFYDSRKHQETGEFDDMLIGGGPYIVNRNNGSLHSTGSAKSIDEYIAEFESQLADGVQNPSPHKQHKRSLLARLFRL